MFDLKTYFKERRRLSDSTLDQALPPETRPPAILHRAMRYAVFPGGKRLRPVLCMAAAEAVGAPGAAALFPAAAVELFHTYTLIHDDLPCMDNDELRRGRPTVHVAFGEANALLAGDALQALAFEVAAKTPVSRPYSPTQIVAELALAAGSRGVVGGQVEDLEALKRKPTSRMIEFIHLHKTADLFRAAVRMGAIAGKARKPQLEALTRYAVNLGMAFQITDDLLDAPTAARRAGKKPASCLMVWDADAAREKAGTLIERAVAALRSFGASQTAPLLAISRLVLERKE